MSGRGRGECAYGVATSKWLRSGFKAIPGRSPARRTQRPPSPSANPTANTHNHRTLRTHIHVTNSGTTCAQWPWSLPTIGRTPTLRAKSPSPGSTPAMSISKGTARPRLSRRSRDSTETRTCDPVLCCSGFDLRSSTSGPPSLARHLLFSTGPRCKGRGRTLEMRPRPTPSSSTDEQHR